MSAIVPMLCISTIHIKPETLARIQTNDFNYLPCFPKVDPVYPSEPLGAFVCAGDVDTLREFGIEHRDIPEDLKTVIRYANKKHILWIMFDSGYDEIDDLPTYHYEWDAHDSVDN